MPRHAHMQHASPAAGWTAPARRTDPAGPTAPALDPLLLHDLLNPMTAVLGQLEMLEDMLEPLLDASTRRYLQECMSSANQLSEMLVNLQTLARIESGQIDARRTGVPVARLLATLQADQELIGGRFEFPAPQQVSGLYVRDVAGLLRQALQVLMRTAMRLAGANGSVTFHASPADDARIHFACSYRGPTLPRPVIDALFTPAVSQIQREHSFRVDRARGLELVQAIMPLIGGLARYEPTDNGGRFVAVVPQEPAPQPAGAAAP